MDKDEIMEAARAATVTADDRLVFGFNILEINQGVAAVRFTLSKDGAVLFVGPTAHLRAGDTLSATDVKIDTSVWSSS